MMRMMRGREGARTNLLAHMDNAARCLTQAASPLPEGACFCNVEQGRVIICVALANVLDSAYLEAFHQGQQLECARPLYGGDALGHLTKVRLLQYIFDPHCRLLTLPHTLGKVAHIAPLGPMDTH